MPVEAGLARASRWPGLSGGALLLALELCGLTFLQNDQGGSKSNLVATRCCRRGTPWRVDGEKAGVGGDGRGSSSDEHLLQIRELRREGWEVVDATV